MGILLIVSIIGAAIYTYQNGINSAWIENLGMRIHRNDLRTGYNRSYDVIIKRAESEASRGLDTYSPSIHTSNSSTAPKDTAQKDTDETPFDLVDIDVTNLLDNLN